MSMLYPAKQHVMFCFTLLTAIITFILPFLIEIIAEKPNYEVGSSAKLSFAKSSVDKAKVAAVWKIDNDDDEIIDADDLLDEEDLVTPDPASLRGIIIIIHQHRFQHIYILFLLFFFTS